jgi:RimJ/RimL family protein N-acetyltransferase
VEAPNGLCLCVFDVPTGQPVGAVNFMTNMPEHLKVELGSIWYSPLVQRTKANLESTYLMLGHAFAIGYRRVEWKCDSLNERSRRSALRMSFRFEGIQECHYIIKGRNRDTAWFRILDHEWPGVKAHVEAMLGA